MSKELSTPEEEPIFNEIAALIQERRSRTLQTVNTELIALYWEVGKIISGKIKTAVWGKGVVNQLAQYLSQQHSGLTGFSRRGLYRMRQFYETYPHNEFVPPLVTQLPWTHNLLIMAQAKSQEEREFYLHLATKEQWSKRELARQLKGALFERKMLAPVKASPLVRLIHPAAESFFKDSYVVEFLELAVNHSEADLHHGLVQNLRKFLKVGRFEPEHLGKLNFYLEALDRDVRKKHENPSIGLLLCASKDDEVVEYALSRSLSPALIAEYQTKLPDKKLLQAKLHEFLELSERSDHS